MPSVNPPLETPKARVAQLAQYLRVCADLAECNKGEPRDGLAYVSPAELRKAIDILERPINETDASRRAEYWKAEHLAGNAEIERLRATLQDLLETRDRAAGDVPEGFVKGVVSCAYKGWDMARALLAGEHGHEP